MKIQALGNGTGRPVNPHLEKEDYPVANGYIEQVNPMWAKFNRDNPALPLYLNGEPYMGSDVVEGERAYRWYDHNDGYEEWDIVSGIGYVGGVEEAVSRLKNNGYKVMDCYIVTEPITPSAPDNDKKAAEVSEGIRIPDLNLGELTISFFDNDVIIYENGSEFAELDKSEIIKLRDFLNSLPL